MTVRELRLVVTADDYDAAVAFYRDVLGLTEAAEYISDDAGRVIILEAGRATLEIVRPRPRRAHRRGRGGPAGRRAHTALPSR